MATWHQSRANVRLDMVGAYSVVSDPPGAPRGIMTFTDEADAIAYAQKAPHSYILPPRTDGKGVPLMRYAVSYGDGNNGVSRLYCDFTVAAPIGSEFLLARLAMLSQFSRTQRPYIARNLGVDEASEHGAQGYVLDPPRSPGWSEHNGAWRLVEIYPADEAVNGGTDRPSYDSLEAAFGGQFVRANRKD